MSTKVRMDVLVEEWQRDAIKSSQLNLSEFVRESLSIYFDSEAVTKQEEAELEREKTLLKLKEAALNAKLKRQEESATAEQKRVFGFEWLKENPQAIRTYKQGAMSQKGWQRLCVALGMKNKNQAEELLEEYLQKNSSRGQS